MANYKLPIITGTSLSIGDVLRWDGSNWVNYADSNYDAAVHTHDTHILQLDGINSNGGAFPFTTSGAVTFSQNLIFPNGGTIGQAAGPLLTFDDTNDFLEITGCKVGLGTPTPLSILDVAGTTGLTWATAGNSLGLVTIGTGGTSGGSLWINTPSLNATFHSGLGIIGTYGTPAQRSVININAYGVKSAGGYGSELAFSITKEGTLTEAIRIDQDCNVGFGTGSPLTGIRQTNLATTTLASHYGQLDLLDDTAQAAGVGGIFYFGGKFNDAGGYTTWSAIQGVKETGGTGNYGGGLKFYTRVQGSSIGNANALKMSINSAGIVSIENTLTLKERAAALGDIAAYGQIWVKSDTPNTLWFTDDTGTDLRITPQDLQTTASPLFANLYITENATSGSISSGQGIIWVKNDEPTTLWFRDDTGVEHQIAYV